MAGVAIRKVLTKAGHRKRTTVRQSGARSSETAAIYIIDLATSGNVKSDVELAGQLR